MRYKSGQLENGKWAVMKNSKRYFTNSVCDTKEEADIEAVRRSAQWYNDKMHGCFEWLTEHDKDFNPNDPRAILC